MSGNTRLPAAFALLTAFAALPPRAHARAEPGMAIENVELKALAGGRSKLLSPGAKANVLVFFGAGQGRSVDALKRMAACERELAGKPVSWAAIVSSSEIAAEVRATVHETGIRMPVLIDAGNILHERLGVRLHPMVGIADGKFKLIAMEPYRQINFSEIVKTRIQILLGEADHGALEKLAEPEKPPSGEDPMKKATRNVHMARRLYEIGQYSDAVRLAQKALLHAEVAQAYTVMGQAYVKLGKCAEASRAFDQAAKLDPKESAVISSAKAACN